MPWIRPLLQAQVEFHGVWHSTSVASVGFENWGVVGPGLLSGVVSPNVQQS